MDLISTYVDIEFTCLVFKTTCIDRRIPLREGTFFFIRIALSLRRIRGILVIKRREKRITSERHIGKPRAMP